MVLWVAAACQEAVGAAQVVIASDSADILRLAQSAGFRSEATSSRARTGTDRVAEVAQTLGGTTILNVQGDEPLVQPADIIKIAEAHRDNPDFVVNGFTDLSPTEDPARSTIPKVVLNSRDELLYASRAPIPSRKATDDAKVSFKKQVCIYAFSPAQLKLFASVVEKTPLERDEDIEILRFLELGQTVKMVRTEGGTVAVDEPADLAVVESLISP